MYPTRVPTRVIVRDEAFTGATAGRIDGARYTVSAINRIVHAVIPATFLDRIGTVQ